MEKKSNDNIFLNLSSEYNSVYYFKMFIYETME